MYAVSSSAGQPMNKQHAQMSSFYQYWCWTDGGDDGEHNDTDYCCQISDRYMDGIQSCQVCSLIPVVGVVHYLGHGKFVVICKMEEFTELTISHGMD